MTKKAELEAKIAELEAKLEKTTKKASKKAEKTLVIADGFHEVKRINSLTGGKDVKISAIVKDNEITGYYLANVFPNYNGNAKGLHIPVGLKEVIFAELDKVQLKQLA